MDYLAKLYKNSYTDLQTKLNLLNEELSHLAEAMTEEERLEKQSSEISQRLAAVSQKDPSQLTSQEAAQLMMDKIMMQGGSMSKATKGLSAKVEQKLRTQVLDREVDPTINQQQRDIESIERIPGILSSTVGRDFEDLRQATQTAMARERRPKAQPQTQSPVASSQQNEAQPYESLKGVPGVEISADTPDWVIRWAKKWGDDPRKIEAMRLGVQSALGGDPTQPMNPKLTAAQVGKLGVKLDRDRTNYSKAKEKYRKENELAGFEGLSAPERQAPITQPKVGATNLEKLKHQLELYGRDVSDFIKIQLMTPNLWSDSEKLYGDLYGSNKGSADPDIERGGYDPESWLDKIDIGSGYIPEPFAHSLIKKNIRKKRFSKESDKPKD